MTLNLQSSRRRSIPPLRADNLDSYVRSVNRVPRLEKCRELELASRVRDGHDAAARDELVHANLRYVVHIARGYAGYGLPLADLIQQGNLGLLRAMSRFDPGMDVRLMTFAAYHIRSEIHDFIVRNWRIVKIATTKAQRRLFFGLRSRRAEAGSLRDLEASAIADELHVDCADVYTMELRLGSADLSLDHAMNEMHDRLDLPGDDDVVATAAAAQWSELQKKALYAAWSQLDERSKDIVRRRWIQNDKAGLRELSEQYDISMERMRQIQNRAISRIHDSMIAAGVDSRLAEA
ncbi:RNA polymerase factor sigma-32 [Hydrocarboniphaga effusa]|jgi:RNA polymerase sigma-32 factor|uniref:RNA polymerase factor sigma-32 n=1 Tax=Hydrocarboniphaga effusa TaxID=243629 RepID=UPI0031383CE8